MWFILIERSGHVVILYEASFIFLTAVKGSIGLDVSLYTYTYTLYAPRTCVHGIPCSIGKGRQGPLRREHRRSSTGARKRARKDIFMLVLSLGWARASRSLNWPLSAQLLVAYIILKSCRD